MEKKFTKEEVREQANIYLRQYSGYSAGDINVAVWSDYTNVPFEYKRPTFADAIVRRIKNVRNKNVSNVVDNILG